MNGIDIKTDFYSFRNEISTKYGEFYSKQCEIFFERAIHFSKTGLPYTAISEAKFALSLSYYESDKYQYIYLIGFLTQIHLDNNFIKKAKDYCDLGFEMLDKNDENFEEDYNAFSQMREIIKGEEWKI